MLVSVRLLVRIEQVRAREDVELNPKGKREEHNLMATKRSTDQKHDLSQPDNSLKLIGTSPLSFDASSGSVLTIRNSSASAKRDRPTVGGSFKSSVYIVYYGITKIGHLNPKDVAAINFAIPNRAKLLLASRETNTVLVSLLLAKSQTKTEN